MSNTPSVRVRGLACLSPYLPWFETTVWNSSALPWLVDDQSTFYPRRIRCLLTQQCVQAFRERITCLLSATCSQRAPYWRSGEALLAKPSRHNQTDISCQPTNWIRWIASSCHLSRMSPAVHSLESPPQLLPENQTSGGEGTRLTCSRITNE